MYSGVIFGSVLQIRQELAIPQRKPDGLQTGRGGGWGGWVLVGGGGGADFLQCETLYCIAGSETVIQVQMQKVHSQAEVCMQKMHKHCA